MESFTIEYAAATGDPLDRTVSILIRDGNGLVVHRAWRLLTTVQLVTVLAAVNQLVVMWGRPTLWDDGDFFELLEEVQKAIATPF